MDVSCHWHFLPGTSLVLAVIPTAQASKMVSWYSFQNFLKLLVTIPVAPIITGTIVHFRFHIRCISIRKVLYFKFLYLTYLLYLLCLCVLLDSTTL